MKKVVTIKWVRGKAHIRNIERAARRSGHVPDGLYRDHFGGERLQMGLNAEYDIPNFGVVSDDYDDQFDGPFY